MGRDKPMKFTPETLLQIYLDGSFTDEAQAEFDALMRRDPAFVEKVTQALSERLGPAPEELVNSVSTSLDAKIGGVWSQYKPSPALRTLKWGAKTALVLGAVGGLFLGGRLLVAKLTAPPAAGVPASVSNALPGHSTAVENSSGSAHPKAPAPVSHSEVPAFSTGTTRVSIPTPGNLTDGKKTASFSSAASNPAPGIPALPPVSTSDQNALQAIPVPNGSGSPAESPAMGSRASTTGATAEGNSLRVAIDLEQPEKVDVTVF